jgi:hypothetical protein
LISVSHGEKTCHSRIFFMESCNSQVANEIVI